MRVIDDKKPEKKMCQAGQTYPGTVEDFDIIDFDRKDGGKGYGLKLKIKPNDGSFFSVTAFDFIGQDENGPFVYRDSKMEKWLLKIFGVDSLAKVILTEVRNKPLRFQVSVEKREYKDKKTGELKSRDFADVSDILAVETSSAPRTETKTAAPAAASAPAEKPKVGAADDWGDGESL